MVCVRHHEAANPVTGLLEGGAGTSGGAVVSGASGALAWPPLTEPACCTSMLDMQQVASQDQQLGWASTCSGAAYEDLPRIRVRQCASPAAAPAAASLVAAQLPSHPLWRGRSATPEDAPALCLSTDRAEESGPITPAAPPSHAAQTPGATARAAARAGGSHTTPPAALAAHGTRDCTAQQHNTAVLWRRIQSFMQCVAGSPLVQSALLSLELGGTFPVATEPGMPAAEAMQWTLAQLLAMHLKAGRCEASEASVLASLWLLESMESIWRSPATACLNDYLKHLAVFSPEAVVKITADWQTSFQELRRSVVNAQLDFLKRLDWCLQLDLATEVKPCLDLLFQLGGPTAAAGDDATPASARSAWALRMHRVCSHVQHQVDRLRKPPRAASRRPQEAESSAQLTPTKRQRTQHA